MKIELVAVGKVREPYLQDGCRLYLKRLRGLMPLLVTEVRSSSNHDGLEIEGARILAHVPDDAVVWVLDEHGQTLTSTTLAARIAAVQRSGQRRLLLAIGGDRGLSNAVCKRASFSWSISSLTLLHEMARLIVLEQLYRAAKINRGEPYHRG